MTSFFKRSPSLEKCFVDHGERVTYTKRQHLVWKNDESVWVFLMTEGLVQPAFSFPDGTQRIIGYFVPGLVFAQSGSFFAEQDGVLSYTAETPVTVYRMKRSDFLLMMDQNPVCAREYLDMTLRNQIFLIDRIVYQGEKGLHAKMLRWLLFMVKYYGQVNGNSADISVPLTQDVVADFLHTTRESVNGVLKDLVREGIVTLTHKKLTVNDISAVRKKVSHAAV